MYCTFSLAYASLFFFNLRVRNELQSVPSITGPEDSDMKSKSQDYIGISNDWLTTSKRLLYITLQGSSTC